MKFTGAIPALVTPYDADGRVNPAAIEAIVDRQIAAGIGGLFVCGSTGEWWLLDEAERREVAATAVKAAAGRVPVMVHVGANSTAAAIRLARHAESAGADAISVLPPTGIPYPVDSIWRHFREIGASCGLPLYLYHLPQVHGDLITVGKFVEALDSIPTLAGAKFSAYRIDDLISLKIQAKGRLNIISGCAEQLMSTIAAGADGSICTWHNVIPALGNKIIAALAAGDLDTARAHQELLVSFGMCGSKKVLAFVKLLLGYRGIECGQPRLPVPQMDPEEGKAMIAGIEALGIPDWMI